MFFVAVLLLLLLLCVFCVFCLFVAVCFVLLLFFAFVFGIWGWVFLLVFYIIKYQKKVLNHKACYFAYKFFKAKLRTGEL